MANKVPIVRGGGREYWCVLVHLSWPSKGQMLLLPIMLRSATLQQAVLKSQAMRVRA